MIRISYISNFTLIYLTFTVSGIFREHPVPGSCSHLFNFCIIISETSNINSYFGQSHSGKKLSDYVLAKTDKKVLSAEESHPGP